ncbi:orotate phosphoribosyltransferase [Nitratiruptor sp. SB155-2]|uniref:Orotate phosphoribosyltransferase n=1 Tax=Nitratiruptor sp. (strain SB155-2) TaxID=387092 RepID=PYRE_NITSB|nr:RecName: Full=Orotate phosphoribosyltransferase; Short=OPRT; Short=OPRTase [Nitratiruptor sp. SB155-2]BAF70948.1 orotate phosphoribosyltransferase [Nitratiruptor sp. SB155-2]
MDIEKIYKESGALLKGHFLLSSGKHSPNYLQSAKVLEDPKKAELLAKELAKQIQAAGIEVDTVCSPAIGGLLAGYELARALGVRFIFTERKDGKMTLRRGFEVEPGEKVLICEDIITTGGSAMEAAKEMEKRGAEVVAFAALANRGVCQRTGSEIPSKSECKLPSNKTLFALADFTFPIYEPKECPMCAEGSEPIKPGSRGN